MALVASDKAFEVCVIAVLLSLGDIIQILFLIFLIFFFDDLSNSKHVKLIPPICFLLMVVGCLSSCSDSK